MVKQQVFDCFRFFTSDISEIEQSFRISSLADIENNMFQIFLNMKPMCVFWLGRSLQKYADFLHSPSFKRNKGNGRFWQDSLINLNLIKNLAKSYMKAKNFVCYELILIPLYWPWSDLANYQTCNINLCHCYPHNKLTYVKHNILFQITRAQLHYTLATKNGSQLGNRSILNSANAAATNSLSGYITALFWCVVIWRWIVCF